MMTDVDEEDDYDKLLIEIGRTFEQDQRVAYHELGHAICSRLTTGECAVSSVTITPSENYEGQCRGIRREAFVKNGVTQVEVADAAHIRAILQPMMPKVGEDRGDKADVYQNVLDACTQLMAGEAAEELLSGEATLAADDRRQVTELAALLPCRSPEAVTFFIEFCKRQARDLLSAHITLLMSLSIVLRIRREMTETELDEAIAIVLAGGSCRRRTL
jgi:hypothetical protein